MIVGIDYGAKLAGTTVVARMYDHNKVDFFASKKKQDADAFILNFLKENEDVWLCYLDAPLSLPKVYSDKSKGDSYFYREADKITGAMSPLFLGGLTARAMKLTSEITKLGIKVVETYPSKLIEVMELKDENYKKKLVYLPDYCDKLKKISGFEFDHAAVKSWHHFDALLCLFSAKRFEMQRAIVFGDVDEGTITV